MNFKKISLIIPLFCVNIKVLANPVITETVDISSESEDEIFSVGDIDLNVTEIFSDDENIVTEVSDIIGEGEEDECSSEECIQTSKRILSNMDISVDPCENFYQFTCGGWESDVLSNGISGINFLELGTIFDKIGKLTDNEIIEIIEGVLSN